MGFIFEAKLFALLRYALSKYSLGNPIFMSSDLDMIGFEYFIFSLPFPINLPYLSGTSGYLYFLFPQENFEVDAKSLTFELSTNRHLTLRKKLLLEKSLHIAP